MYMHVYVCYNTCTALLMFAFLLPITLLINGLCSLYLLCFTFLAVHLLAVLCLHYSALFALTRMLCCFAFCAALLSVLLCLMCCFACYATLLAVLPRMVYLGLLPCVALICLALPCMLACSLDLPAFLRCFLCICPVPVGIHHASICLHVHPTYLNISMQLRHESTRNI